MIDAGRLSLFAAIFQTGGMALTYAERLELAETCLDRRLAGDAYDEYNNADRAFKGTPTDKIPGIISWLKQMIAQESSGGGVLLMPTDL